MALPLVPFLGLGLQALNALSVVAVAGILLDREFGGDALTPDVLPQQPPFSPPFVGGQCSGNPNLGYWIGVDYRNPDLNQNFTISNPVAFGSQGMIQLDGGLAISGVSLVKSGIFSALRVVLSNGSVYQANLNHGNSAGGQVCQIVTTHISLYNYVANAVVADSCGNLPNPNEPIPNTVGGGSLQALPSETPIQVVEGGIPAGVLGILAALKTIADGIKIVGDVLDGVRSIGDAIGKIKDYLEGKEKKEREAARIWAGSWFEMREDGGFGVISQLIDGNVLFPNYIQIEIESFPKGASVVVGRKSPSFCIREPLGYILPRSSNGCYSEAFPINFLRTNIPLPQDCNGISYNFLRFPNLKAKCRIWYVSEPNN